MEMLPGWGILDFFRSNWRVILSVAVVTLALALYLVKKKSDEHK